MAIGSSNVSFSTIASARGIANSNLSLKSLSGKEVKTAISTNGSSSYQGGNAIYGSDYGLCKQKWKGGGHVNYRVDSTPTSAQGSGSAGLNTASYSMSEWVGSTPNSGNYTRVGQGGSSANSTSACLSDDEEAANSCQVRSNATMSVYCKKVSGDIYIYCANNIGSFPLGWAQNGRSGDARALHSGGTNYPSGTFNGEIEMGRMTPVTSGMIPTGCTMSYTTGYNYSSGGFWSSGAGVYTVSGGSTSTSSLGSTKIGYGLKVGGVSEAGAGTTSNAIFRVGVRFNWTWPTSPSGDSYNSNYTEVWCDLRAVAIHSGFGYDIC